MTFVKRVPEEEASVLKILEPYAAMARPLTDLTLFIMRDEAVPFTHAERELIAAFTSGVNACTYCFETHRATAEAFGVEEKLLDALVDDVDSAPVDEKLKPILKYVRKLTVTPTRMVQADADAVFAAGWSEDALHYAISICGLFNFYNRLLEGYGAKNTADFRRMRGAELAGDVKGYESVVNRG